MKIRVEFCLMITAMLFLGINLQADVIKKQNGEIYLGVVESTDAYGITVNSFGTKFSIKQSEILKSEKDLTSLKNQNVEIELKDGSIIRGKIQNYDEEIGILVNIDFGALTLPVQAIKSIKDPGQNKVYAGSPVRLGALFGYSFPVGGLQDDLNSGISFSFLAEFNSKLLRGMYFGGDFSFSHLSANNSSELSYNIFSLQPYIMFGYMGFHSGSSFMRNVTPYISLGGGISLVSLTDKRPDSLLENQNEIDFSIKFSAGVDYLLLNTVNLRLCFNWFTIPQESKWFNSASVNLGALYAF